MSGIIGLRPMPGMNAMQAGLRILAGLAILAALLTVSYCKGRGDGKAIEVAAQQRAVIKVQQKAMKAGDQADVQRTADAARQIQVEKRYDEAIAGAADGPNSPAAVAYACEQLRTAGYAGTDLPAECGRSSGH